MKQIALEAMQCAVERGDMGGVEGAGGSVCVCVGGVLKDG